MIRVRPVTPADATGRDTARRPGDRKTVRPPSYLDRLLSELGAMESGHLEIVEASAIRYINPNRHNSGVFVVGAADWGWAPSDAALEARRMAALRRLRDWMPRFRLLFPDPTPEVTKRLKKDLGHLERWLVRDGRYDHSIPDDVAKAAQLLQQTVERIRSMRTLLPADPWAVRLVVDTNAVLDTPDLAVYRPQIGNQYMAHLLPVVLRELDDHKRAGRSPELREAAKRADRRLKALRDNGDVLVGARVAGEVYAVFEHIEPNPVGLPSWLDLAVPDDRFVASTLRLQSGHPGSALYVATSDLNLQTKLAAVSLPFVEPPTDT